MATVGLAGTRTNVSRTHCLDPIHWLLTGVEAPKAGDYVGLNLVGTIKANRVLIHTRKRLPNPVSAFKLSIIHQP